MDNNQLIEALFQRLDEIDAKLDNLTKGLYNLSQTYLADRQTTSAPKPAAPLARPVSSTPHVTLKCPKCGSPMQERYNKSSGEMFYGCTQFPDCRGTRQANGSSGRNSNVIKPSEPAEDYDAVDDDIDVPF